MILENLTERVVRLRQDIFLMKTMQVLAIQRRIALRIPAVEQKLHEDDAGKKIMNHVVIESMAMEPRTYDEQIFQQQGVGSLVATKALLVSNDKATADKLQPVQRLVCLRGHRRSIPFPSSEAVARLPDLRTQPSIASRGAG